MHNLRILFVHPDLTYFGGAEKVLVHMIRALKVHDISLLSSWWDPPIIGKQFGDIEIPKIQWIKCPPFLLKYKRFRAFQWIKYSNNITKIVRDLEKDYDIIIETQQVYITPQSNVVLINYMHYPYLIIPPPEADNTIIRLYYSIQRRILLKRLKRINLVLTNSPFTANIMQDKLGMEPIVVYPPVEVQKFHSETDWEEREDKVVNIGTFIPFKRQIILLEIARLLPKIKFVLIGWLENRDSNYYQNIINNKPHNVEVLHNVPDDTLIKELRSSKAYVHLCPEHFGISVIEAIAAGCAPIVYHLGGPIEILGNSALSWSDTRELADSIERVISDEKLWRNTIVNAKSKLTKFKTSIFEQKIRDIIKLFNDELSMNE